MLKRGKRVTALSLSVMLMLNMTATALPVYAAAGESKTYTHDGYTVEYTVKNEWTGNQNIEVTITNTGDDILSGWAMGYNAFGEIGGLWNAKIYGQQGTEYILSSAGYNDELAPGQSTNFGYTLKGDNFKIPQNIYNCAERVDITDGYNVYYNITGDYGDTYQAEMVIENLSDTDINAWQLSFDGNATIDNLWNGKLLENENGSFKVKNAEHNVVIGAGNSTSFNLSGTKLAQETELDVTETAAPATEPVVETTAVTDVSEEAVTDVSETDIAVSENDTEAVSESETVTETEISVETEISAETEIVTETEAITETTTVFEQEIETKAEVVFDNFKLTGIVIPMEFDFEIDPEMDSDEDGLPDYIEKEIGSDRYNPDTDSDKLPDGYEYFMLGTDPIKEDSDDNTISDADEDFDEDNLSNLEEYNLGTDPFSKDSDYDNLSDYDEVNIHNTDPTEPDSDTDKVSDGDEIELGLDPNNPATNGYPDNEYTTEQTVGEDSEALDYINNIEDNPYTVSVEITAAGVAENNLSAGESGYSYSILQNDAVLGVVPELSYSDGLSVTDVVINFNIDNSAVAGGLGIFDEGGINRYGIFMYFEDTNALLPIETFYDESANVISAHIDRLGTLCIVDIEKWLNNLNELPDEPYYLEDDEANEPANIVFCIDSKKLADENSLNDIKTSIKTVAADAFERYSRIKVYVYYQQFGIDFNVKNNLLTEPETGNNYFTSYDKFENAVDNFNGVSNSSWMYDLVGASQYMIDNCDENIVAIYHFTENERIMGSVNSAKKLNQTIQNSTYTTADGEIINRIYISTICSDSQTVNGDSYVYDLAELSDGIVYINTNDSEESNSVETYSATISNYDEVASNNTSELKGEIKATIDENTDTLGDGRDPNFYHLLTSIGIKDIRLNTPLKRDDQYRNSNPGPTDTDHDGILDWNEVDLDTLCAIMGIDKETITSLKYNELPSLSNYQSYYDNNVDHSEYSYEYVKKGIGMVQAQSKQYFNDVLESARILPIYSDPTSIDSDDDGFLDNAYVNNYENVDEKDKITYEWVKQSDKYFNVSDPNPLKKEIIWQWPAYYSDGTSIDRLQSAFREARTNPHSGIDITPMHGHRENCFVVAAYDGKIINMVDNHTDAGYYIEIEHNISGKKYISRYLHLEKFEESELYKKYVNSQKPIYVKAGDIIATISGTPYGNYKTNDSGKTVFVANKNSNNLRYSKHLHYTLSMDKWNNSIDPLCFDTYLNGEQIEEPDIMFVKVPKTLDQTCDNNCKSCQEYFKKVNNNYKLGELM